MIASTAPKQLYQGLLGGADLPETVRDDLQGFRHGKGNLQVHYALSRPPRWRDGDLGGVALLHLTPGLDGVSRCVERGRARAPAGGSDHLRRPADRARSEPGAGGPGDPVAAICPAPRVLKGDAPAKSPSIPPPAGPRRSASLCRPHRGDPRPPHRGFRRDQDRPARLLPGRSRSPQRQSRRRRSLWRGLRARPVLPVAAAQGLGEPRTFVPGLYHIGASTHPGPGLGGGSGFLLAQSLA